MLSPIVAELASADRLFVVSDFDGTLAGFSADAYNVPVNSQSLAALTRLAGMPDTRVAILSGRHLEGLAEVCDLRAPIIRAGSHGNESSFSTGPSLAQQKRLDEIEAALKPLLDEHGTFVERKPFQRVAHVATLAKKDPEKAEEILRKIAQLDFEGAHVIEGKNIVEFSVTSVTKGTWIEKVRDQYEPERTVFVGDDVTDEQGFAVLGEKDYGIKVGEGHTAASARVANIEEVAEFFTELADARAAHIQFPRDTAGRFEWCAAGLGAIVHQVEDWSVPTPCTGWSARDVIRHLNTWVPKKLGLEPVPGDDPVDEYFTFIDAVRALLDDDNRAALECVCTSLNTDLFVHTWDMARAIGVDPKLDENFASRLLRHYELVNEERMVETGHYDPPVEIPADASPVEQLVAATGRDPRASLVE